MSAVREINRIQYLQAMGITPYVSRRALPGAAVTRRLAMRALSVREPPVELAAAAWVGATTPQGPTAGLLSEQFRVTAPARSSSDRPVAASSASPTVQGRGGAVHAAARFRLAVLVYAGRLWVEDLGDGALATQQLQLITAIGRALVHPSPAPLTPPLVTQFDWPIHSNTQLDLGAGEAAATLQGFLHRQIEESGCVELMCLGEPAQRRLRGLQLPCARRELLDTQSLLEQPLRKRELWAALRP